MSEKVHIGPWPGSSAESEPAKFSLKNESYFLSFLSLVERVEKQIPEDIIDRISKFSVNQPDDELEAIRKMSIQEIFGNLNVAALDWNFIPHYNYYLIKEARKRLDEFIKKEK